MRVWDRYLNISDFDRPHWWHDPAPSHEISPEASWFELLRRHPSLDYKRRGSLLINAEWDGVCLANVLTGNKRWRANMRQLLLVIGLQSWLTLSEANRDAFRRVLAATKFRKGLNRKATVSLLRDPSRYRQDNRFASKPPRSLPFLSSNPFALLKNAAERNDAVFAASFDTDDPQEAAARLAAEYLSAYQRSCAGRPNQNRSPEHWRQWLRIISAYEESEEKRLAQGDKICRDANQRERRAFQRLFIGIAL